MAKTSPAERQEFVVAAGVSRVAGQPVPKNRKVMLTPREALYDLALGRIAASPAKPTPASAAEPVSNVGD